MQNNAEAQNGLGVMYELGWPGHRPDLEKAIKYYRLSADQNNLTGQYDLADMYEQGKGVPKDRNKAIELYRKAATQGQADAKKRLEALGESLP